MIYDGPGDHNNKHEQNQKDHDDSHPCFIASEQMAEIWVLFQNFL